MKVTQWKHTRISPHPRRRYADVGRHVQRKNENINQNAKTQTKHFTFCTCPDVSAGPSWNKQLMKELLAPAPGRSRFGELNPRP